MFPPNTRILVVDDFVTMRLELVSILMELGYKDVQEAENGRQAWQVLTGSDPAIGLILSDWNMPSSSGMDLLKRVRGEARYKDLPFIMVTTENEKKSVLEAAKIGVNSYIVKPYTLETVKEKIEAVHKKLSGGS